MTEPTDAELDELRQANSGRLNFVTLSEFRTIARAVLAKWGQPAHSGEPVAWKHDCAALLTNDVELWIDACPHCGKPRKAPQPVEREPLTCEWTHNDDDGYWDTSCGKAWRFDDGGPKENNMNFCHCCGKTLRIKGGQHGTE